MTEKLSIRAAEAKALETFKVEKIADGDGFMVTGPDVAPARAADINAAQKIAAHARTRYALGLFGVDHLTADTYAGMLTGRVRDRVKSALADIAAQAATAVQATA